MSEKYCKNANDKESFERKSFPKNKFCQKAKEIIQQNQKESEAQTQKWFVNEVTVSKNADSSCLQKTVEGNYHFRASLSNEVKAREHAGHEVRPFETERNASWHYLKVVWENFHEDW